MTPEEEKRKKASDAFYKWHTDRGLKFIQPDEQPDDEPYLKPERHSELTIAEMLRVDPSTRTAELCILPGIMNRATHRKFALERNKSTAFKDIIYRNAQWLVRGDATVEEAKPNGYQCDGDDILDGMGRNGRLHETWPYHVCQKPWVDAALFCDAYSIAYYHKQMTLARAELAKEQQAENN